MPRKHFSSGVLSIAMNLAFSSEKHIKQTLNIHKIDR